MANALVKIAKDKQTKDQGESLASEEASFMHAAAVTATVLAAFIMLPNQF